MKLIWLFKEYHELVSKHGTLERAAELLAEKNIQLTKDNVELAKQLEIAQSYIKSNPSVINSVMDLLQKYQEKILEEDPFGPDQQPQWLTAGYEGIEEPPVKENDE